MGGELVRAGASQGSWGLALGRVRMALTTAAPAVRGGHGLAIGPGTNTEGGQARNLAGGRRSGPSRAPVASARTGGCWRWRGRLGALPGGGSLRELGDRPQQAAAASGVRRVATSKVGMDG